MALATTTLSSACALGDKQIVVVSATSFSAGRLVLIDQETMIVAQSYSSGTTIPVLRGKNGSVQAAHVSTANVVHGLASDFASNAPQEVTGYPVAGRARTLTSYGAAGAITLPTAGNDAVAIINGTGALAMTLANPTKDQDGCILIICGNGIAAHTVTYTAGFGNVGGTADVMTFGANQAQAFQCIAANGFWNLLGPLAVATANVSGPSLA